MSKDNFLGLLKASQKSVSAEPAPPAQKSSWAVVQDDYMMGAKLKDWDAAHGTEVGRVQQEAGKDEEAAETAAWSQVGAMDSDDDSGAAAGASTKKRRSDSGAAKKGGKKLRR